MKPLVMGGFPILNSGAYE